MRGGGNVDRGVVIGHVGHNIQRRATKKYLASRVQERVLIEFPLKIAEPKPNTMGGVEEHRHCRGIPGISLAAARHVWSAERVCNAVTKVKHNLDKTLMPETVLVPQEQLAFVFGVMETLANQPYVVY